LKEGLRIQAPHSDIKMVSFLISDGTLYLMSPPAASVPGEITLLLSGAGAGDNGALRELLEIVYPELRRLARVAMRRDWFHHTLQGTAVVHEAFLRLFRREIRMSWENREIFFLSAASEMRRVLIEHARSRHSMKRWGEQVRVPLNERSESYEDRLEQSAVIAQAVERLKQIDPRGAQVVDLRFFAGLTHEEIARVLNYDARTVERDWNFAKGWLRHFLSQ
jgi:RNA polymerase sigma factor (TIGR02999 family)